MTSIEDLDTCIKRFQPDQIRGSDNMLRHTMSGKLTICIVCPIFALALESGDVQCADGSRRSWRAQARIADFYRSGRGSWSCFSRGAGTGAVALDELP
jgi:hypothetical protein